MAFTGLLMFLIANDLDLEGALDYQKYLTDQVDYHFNLEFCALRWPSCMRLRPSYFHVFLALRGYTQISSKQLGCLLFGRRILPSIRNPKKDKRPCQMLL